MGEGRGCGPDFSSLPWFWLRRKTSSLNVHLKSVKHRAPQAGRFAPGAQELLRRVPAPPSTVGPWACGGRHPQEPLNYESGWPSPLPDQGFSGRRSQSNRHPARTATPGVQLSYCQEAGARSKRSPPTARSWEGKSRQNPHGSSLHSSSQATRKQGREDTLRSPHSGAGFPEGCREVGAQTGTGEL